MALYTFYPETPAGSCISFEAIELPSDDAACERALDVLSEHASAEAVAIWCSERFISLIKRRGLQAHRQINRSNDGASAA